MMKQIKLLKKNYNVEIMINDEADKVIKEKL